MSEPHDPNRPSASEDAPSTEPAQQAPPEHLPELQWIVDALDDKRAKDVVVLDLAPLTVSVDCFVIATGESLPQIEALEDAVRSTMKERGRLPRGVEAPSSRWVLLDYGGVVVHVMSPDAREFYDIEGLWADAEELPIRPS